MLPGLVDAHGHLMYLARLRLALDVAGLASEAACAERVAARARAPPRRASGSPGRGWDQNRWPGARFPTRASLDRAAPDHPVTLVRVDGHAIWANSAALRARRHRSAHAGSAGRPPRARRERRADRRSGRHRAGAHPAGRAAPERRPRWRTPSRRPIGRLPRRRAHRRPRDGRRPRRPRRLSPARGGAGRSRSGTTSRSGAPMPRRGRRRSTSGPGVLGDGRLVVGAVKLMADGALGSRGRGACTRRTATTRTNRGLLLLPFDELEGRARAAAARGFQVCVHAIGDRANTLVLDALESVLRGRPSAARRPPRRRPGDGPAASGGARSDPGGAGHPPLPAARRPSEHAADALHLGHALGRRAAGGRSAPRRLRLALAPPDGDRHRRRLGLPRRAAEPVPRDPRRRHAPAARRARIPAGSPSSG